MPPRRPDWLDVVRHRVRGLRVPYLLVVQHHAIPSTTRLCAPVSSPYPRDLDVLAPPLVIEDAAFRVRVLDIGAVPLALLGETVASMAEDRDEIMSAIDIVLHGYPVGIPR